MPQSLIIVILLSVLAAVAVAEVLSLKLDPYAVSLDYSVNMNLTEPDEIAALNFRFQNHSVLPMPFVSFSFVFSDAVEVREDEARGRRDGEEGMFGHSYAYHASLMPRRARKGTLRFSLKERGRHELGKIYVETGDFLGFRSKVRSFEIRNRMICTARSLGEDPALAPLGGYLGDVSVRRFVHEDNSLILGDREYPGVEPMKDISWSQTARTGVLTVKKHDFTVDVDVTVLLDVEQCASPVAERCLSLVRTVCDTLEARKIPYAVLSNGDLFETEKGMGRKHSFEVQRRIGVTHFTRYQSFGALIGKWSGPAFGRRGFIVIAPAATPELLKDLARLENASGVKALLLTGGEAAQDA